MKNSRWAMKHEGGANGGFMQENLRRFRPKFILYPLSFHPSSSFILRLTPRIIMGKLATMEEILSQIWDALGDVFGGIGRAVERSLTSLFGSSNARYLKKLQPTVDAISALEPKYQAMTDAELKEQTAKFRKRLAGGRDARRPAGRGLCRLPRGRPPLPGHAALRRAIDGRHRAAPRQHRRNGHRRRQDAGGHAAGLPQRPGRQGRPRGHGQRLPGPPRHGMDGPALHVAGPDGRRDPEPHGDGRAAEGLRLRHHLRHEQRVRLRLPPRQHAAGGQATTTAIDKH